MAAAITAVDSHRFSPRDRLFFDTNVWLRIHAVGYDPNDQDVKAYSSAFRRCLDAGCPIFVDVIVLSEFVNRYARWRFWTQAEAQKLEAFKSFRNSSAFKPVATEIADACRRILGTCRRLDDPFCEMDPEELLSEFEAGKVDLNDQLIARLCATQKLTLMTDDGDFGGFGVPILTANRRMLAGRRR
mgnify:CR=1 FL=1